jgi:predicted RNase H-like HicB family nuclease
MMRTLPPSKRTILFYPNEDGVTMAEVPSLPGCIAQGETREEALQNIQDAIGLHIEHLQASGQPIPIDQVEVMTVMI